MNEEPFGFLGLCSVAVNTSVTCRLSGCHS